MSKTVLVTAAAGFVGRHVLSPLAERGYEVHAVTRRVPSAELLGLAGVVWHQGDLLVAEDRKRLIEATRPSHLLHLAWVTAHGRYWEAPENRDWVTASMDLADRAAAAGCRRIVGAGTCAEYDWTVPALINGDGVEMITPCKPATRYGRSKTQFKEWLNSRQDVSTAWGRLFFLYGVAEDHRRLVASTIIALLAGKSAKIGPGIQVRDFLDTRDAAAAFAALIDGPVEGPVNIASGTGRSLAEIITTIGELMGRRDRVAIGALPPQPNEPPRLVGDVTRLTYEVGFRPRHDLADGLAHTIAWWRSAIHSTVR